MPGALLISVSDGGVGQASESITKPFYLLRLIHHLYSQRAPG